MATNLIQENNALANLYGIPRITENSKQRIYYPYHLRRCVNWLRWVMLVNVLLMFILLYLFFFRATEPFYSTSFSGKVTPLTVYNSLPIALQVTQKNVSQGSNI